MTLLRFALLIALPIASGLTVTGCGTTHPVPAGQFKNTLTPPPPAPPAPGGKSYWI